MVFQNIKGQNSRMKKSWSKIELGVPSKTCTAFHGPCSCHQIINNLMEQVIEGKPNTVWSMDTAKIIYFCLFCKKKTAIIQCIYFTYKSVIQMYICYRNIYHASTA